jgi:hypothetical protein
MVTDKHTFETAIREAEVWKGPLERYGDPELAVSNFHTSVGECLMGQIAVEELKASFSSFGGR